MDRVRALEELLGGFDRAAHRRVESEWLRGQLQAPAWIVPSWRGQNLFGREGGRPPLAVRPEAHACVSEGAVFLGTQADGHALFALDISLGAETQEEALDKVQVARSAAFFVTLRGYDGSLTHPVRALLFYVRALMNWHENQRFCSRCGSPTRPEEGGHMMACTNESCGAKIFPRSDPATIMLVHHGDRCLLGRQPSWPEGVYSTLAGFVEAGETVEQAVIREVKEESGIEVTNLRYFASQPWPFPQSLMLGFHAEALNSDLVCGPELADVRWFDREETRALLGRLITRYPHLDTIARRLIRAWLEGMGASVTSSNT
ncbi:MAG: NAD(+) diphosphatase [Verrucomicrobia bacterium]|nr:NAD(+) diphosphatase [Verrucomicrobiota bacterium]